MIEQSFLGWNRFLGSPLDLESESLDPGLCILSHSSDNLYAVIVLTSMLPRAICWPLAPESSQEVRIQPALWFERMDLDTHRLLLQDASILVLDIAEKKHALHELLVTS
jgi:hypothetical protein